jgi:hypothetical protein
LDLDAWDLLVLYECAWACLADSALWIDRIYILIAKLHNDNTASTFFWTVNNAGFDISKRGENIIVPTAGPSWPQLPLDYTN